MLTQERLKELLHYDLETGIFSWRVRRKGVKPGRPAGSLSSSHGYRDIRVEGKLYLAHRLAFLYVLGRWPESEHVDHRNQRKDDNSWENLREASASQNGANAKVSVSNKLRVKGVHVNRHGKYVASITVGREAKNLGSYATLGAAKAAYDLAAYLYHGEFAA